MKTLDISIELSSIAMETLVQPKKPNELLQQIRQFLNEKLELMGRYIGCELIENRSLGAIRTGGMVPGVICLHAASGMTEKEYRWGAWRLERHGVRCPRPDELVRGAIIGTIEVTGIVTESDSE